MKNIANTTNTPNAINTAITSTVTEVDEPTDLELALELYEERKEELYQLNLKYGEVLGKVIAFKKLAYEHLRHIEEIENNKTEYVKCLDCGTNDEQEFLLGEIHATKNLVKLFDIIMKDVLV